MTCLWSNCNASTGVMFVCTVGGCCYYSHKLFCDLRSFANSTGLRIKFWSYASRAVCKYLVHFDINKNADSWHTVESNLISAGVRPTRYDVKYLFNTKKLMGNEKFFFYLYRTVCSYYKGASRIVFPSAVQFSLNLFKYIIVILF